DEGPAPAAADAEAEHRLDKLGQEGLGAAAPHGRRAPAAAGGDGAPAAAGKRRTHLCARLRGSLRLISIDEVRYLQAEEKYVVVHHARGQDLIEESLKSLEEEFGERFVRIRFNCLLSRDELVELRRSIDGQVHAILRNG